MAANAPGARPGSLVNES